MNILNLGILAHVDAGKTSLTERLLFNNGVIDHIGRVDDGTTQTDSLALERQRGITIKSAVVSFISGNTTINLIDTPGHSDFIAEVERVLCVLDGAILVISAVEGVQPQTRVLMRTLRRLRIPSIMFVNKLDRLGADYDRSLREITEKLTPNIVSMGRAKELGTHGADFELQGAGGLDVSRAYPVFAGSAITGAGVEALNCGVTQLLPPVSANAGGPTSGSVFKIERGHAGEKIAYVRLFSGTIRTRNQVSYGSEKQGKVTAIGVFHNGGVVKRSQVNAGEIGKLWGLSEVKIGDTIGAVHGQTQQRQFAPPTLETVAEPRHLKDKGKLQAALEELAEQDPLINLRQDNIRGELHLSLYGEVQKEVIGATLEADYGLNVQFRATTPICAERPIGTGGGYESGQRGDPFLGTVGLTIEPAMPGSGIQYRLSTDVRGTMPAAFFKAVEDTVYETLRQGLYGWQVTDCVVTLTHTGYLPRQSHAHARFDKSMSSTGADFRGLVPLVLLSALKRAGTVVCEPYHRFVLEAPAEMLGSIMPALAELRAVPQATNMRGASCAIEGSVPAECVHELQIRVPNVTRGEGILETAFDHYAPVVSKPPIRPRTDNNPLDRMEYLRKIAQRN